MKKSVASAFVIAGLLLTSACSSIYYGTMEKFGVHKRDILVDRVKEARDAQQDAKKQFTNALDRFRTVIAFEGGDLEAKYNKLNDAYERSKERAQAVHDRIAAVEDVSEALFSEWRDEIKQYSSDSLRAQSQQQLDTTKAKYKQLIGAMKKAAARIDPVLAPMHDQVLFLKHNLNAKAIASLNSELVTVQTNVNSLVRDMEAAIAEADTFIKAMQEQK